jgi:hypothetical protein
MDHTILLIAGSFFTICCYSSARKQGCRMVCKVCTNYRGDEASKDRRKVCYSGSHTQYRNLTCLRSEELEQKQHTHLEFDISASFSLIAPNKIRRIDRKPISRKSRQMGRVMTPEHPRCFARLSFHFLRRISFQSITIDE